MAENKLAGLSAAENATGNDTITSDGPDTIVTGGAAEHLPGDTMDGGEASDATQPAAGEADDKAGDTIATRSADAEAEPHTDPAPLAVTPDTADAIHADSTMGTLNATPGADPAVRPSLESQRTGPKDDTVFRAPAMTRGSAINQLEIRWAELVTMLHDFDHDISDLPDDLQALVGFVQSRLAA